LVDDEALVLGALGEFLEEHGYRVLIADSGEEALACYERASGAVSLVILDLGMAGMGGITCLEHLRRLDAGARVLVASGYADEASARQAAEAGALGFLSKPFRLADVVTRVRGILDS
jgi:DNA-binding response OmpR family regulator